MVRDRTQEENREGDRAQEENRQRDQRVERNRRERDMERNREGKGRDNGARG